MKTKTLVIALLGCSAIGYAQSYSGVLTHTNGYFTIEPYNSTLYDDGSAARIFYDGNNKRIQFWNTDSGTSHTNIYVGDVKAYGKITTTGELGIGTTNTGNGVLTVNGENGNGIRIENDGLGNEASLRFRSRNLSGDSYHADLSTYYNGSTGFIGFKSPQNNNPGLGYRFIVNDLGNVGIGTTTPDDKLTVKGRIHAEEVKVDLSVPGPDYVFKEGYDLRSLEEVQEHILENGHLPNIPSAQEMEKNGLELGIMNIKLLEKIEELTLYMIDVNKRVELLEKENAELRKER